MMITNNRNIIRQTKDKLSITPVDNSSVLIDYQTDCTTECHSADLASPKISLV